MDFELKLDKPATKMACIEGIVMGVSYFVGKLSKVYVLPCTATLMTWRTGGLLPMILYFAFRHRVDYALFTSIGVTAAILLGFGYVKALVTGCKHRDAVRSAVQTLVVGVVAAGVSYGIVRGVNSVQTG